jgi:toxin-antitoxin system PIN domain toxin
VIALDTNLLVYAHRPEAPLHEKAFQCVQGLAASRQRWSVPIHCLVEFAAVVSNPRIWRQPSSIDQIERQIAAWRASPGLFLLADNETVWETCTRLARQGELQAGRWYDARVAATCLAHGVSVLWTVDRDFSRFAELETHNPLSA